MGFFFWHTGRKAEAQHTLEIQNIILSKTSNNHQPNEIKNFRKREREDFNVVVNMGLDFYCLAQICPGDMKGET